MKRLLYMFVVLLLCFFETACNCSEVLERRFEEFLADESNWPRPGKWMDKVTENYVPPVGEPSGLVVSGTAIKFRGQDLPMAGYLEDWTSVLDDAERELALKRGGDPVRQSGDAEGNAKKNWSNLGIRVYETRGMVSGMMIVLGDIPEQELERFSRYNSLRPFPYPVWLEGARLDSGHPIGQVVQYAAEYKFHHRYSYWKGKFTPTGEYTGNGNRAKLQHPPPYLEHTIETFNQGYPVVWHISWGCMSRGMDNACDCGELGPIDGKMYHRWGSCGENSDGDNFVLMETGETG